MLRIQTILHPTDFSDRSKTAFSLAYSLARDHGASLILLHVIPPGTLGLLAVGDMGHETTTSVKAGFWKELETVKGPDDRVPLKRRLEIGDPAAEIVRVAQEQTVDLIVMATHDHSTLGKLFANHVADHVVHKAPCPVLTVRAPMPHAAS